MNIIPLAGGVYADGGFTNNMVNHSPKGGSQLVWSEYNRLVPDPLGRNYLALRSFLTQRDYLNNTGVVYSKKAENQEKATLPRWGEVFTYHFRDICPLNWSIYSPLTGVVTKQLHDVNGGGDARVPTFSVQMDNYVERFCKAHDESNPVQTEVYRYTRNPGQEVDVTVQALWCDGVIVPINKGFFRIFVGDVLVYELAGKNSYATPTDANPSYLCNGVYKPVPTDSTWVGKSVEWFQIAAFRVAGIRTPYDCRQYVDYRLAANPIF